MIEDYVQSVARDAIKSLDFLLVDREEFTGGFTKKKNIFIKNLGTKYTILELHNLDEYTEEEIKEEIMEKTTNIMKIFTSPVEYKIFKVFIGHGEQTEEVRTLMMATHLHEVTIKKFVKPIYVDFDKKTINCYYENNFPSDGLVDVLSKNLKKDEDRLEKFDKETIIKANKEKQREYYVDVMSFNSRGTYTLILLNILVYIVAKIRALVTGTSYFDVMCSFGIKDNVLIRQGEYFRLLAPVFLHAGVIHLLLNCYALHAIARPCERLYGNLKFICIYLLSGICGCIANFAFSNSLSLGASGAIFGILGATLYFKTQKPVAFKSIFGSTFISIIILNLLLGFMIKDIDNYGHIGGLLAGFLLAGIFRYKKEDKWYIRNICLILFIVIYGGMLYLGFNKVS